MGHFRMLLRFLEDEARLSVKQMFDGDFEKRSKGFGLFQPDGCPFSYFQTVETVKFLEFQAFRELFDAQIRRIAQKTEVGAKVRVLFEGLGGLVFQFFSVFDCQHGLFSTK